MSRSFRKLFLFSLLLFIALVVSFYLALPKIIPPILDRSLRAIGARNVTVGAVAFNFNKLAIEEGEFDWELAGFSIGAKLREMALSWDLRALLKKQVSSVTIGSGNFEIVTIPEVGEEIKQSAALGQKISAGFSKGVIIAQRDHDLLVHPMEVVFTGLIPAVYAPQTDDKISADFEEFILGSDSKSDLRFKANLDSLSLNGTLGYDWQSGAGILDLRSAYSVSVLTLAQLWPQFLPKPLKITNGDFFAGFSIPWQENALVSEQGLLDIDITNFGGSWNETQFEESSLKGSLLPLKGLKSEKDLNFAVGRIIAGIEITNIYGRLSLADIGSASAKAQFSGVTGTVFGAEIKLSPFTLEAKERRTSFSATIKSIDIAEILKLYPSAKLTGKGILDGKLPVTAGADGVTISQGTVSARAPGGILRCDLSTWAKSSPDNPGIALAARALSNFQYTSLSAGIEYNKRGDLLLKVAMVGSNPDLNQGQPINVNLNIEENVPALLSTLQLINSGPQGLNLK